MPKLTALVLICTLGLTGCGLELATLGAAASATQAGTAVMRSGKLRAAVLIDDEVVYAAAERAVADMGMTVKRTKSDPETGRHVIVCVDDHGQKMKWKIQARTDELTWVQINVGFTGHPPTARLAALRLREALEAALGVSELGDALDTGAVGQ